MRKDRRWHRRRCRCGGAWLWWGSEGEGVALGRMWAEGHKRVGCHVNEEQG
jgi:hypothetical protein